MKWENQIGGNGNIWTEPSGRFIIRYVPSSGRYSLYDNGKCVVGNETFRICNAWAVDISSR
jgi:hypothetical protein